MSALINLLTMLVTTAAGEYFVLRLWQRRRSLRFCIILVGFVSGIFWAAFSWTFFLIAASGRPQHDPPNVGSGLDWTILAFVIWALFLSGVALIPAGLTAFIYRRFRSEL
jgi:hypothetical protein